MEKAFKRSLSIFLAITIIFSSVYVGLNEIDFSGIFVVRAEAVSVDDLTFTLSSDGTCYTVTDCNTSASGELVIPETYNVLPVTHIGAEAFRSCASLTSIKIPDNIISIGNYGFANCTNLTSVYIGNNITSIGTRAFYNCKNLNKVYWNAKSVNDFTTSSAVFYNAGTASVGMGFIFGVNVEKIPAYLSYTSNSSSSPKITTITIGENVTSIGNYAFRDCTQLEKVYWNAKCVNDLFSASNVLYNSGSASLGIDLEFGDNVEKIPAYLCNVSDSSYRPQIKNVTIGENVNSIGEYAFYGCSNLENVYISNLVAWCTIVFDDDYANPLYYGDKLYINGELVTSIEIPNGVTTISPCLFSCKNLVSITIPDTVKSIKSYAFLNCTNLISIIIPESVTSIENGVFSGCTSLERVYWNAKKIRDFSSSTNLFLNAGKSGTGIELVFGDNVEKVPAYLCYVSNSSYKPKISKVIIGENVTSIGNYAFNDCTSLEMVTIGENVTSIGKRAFGNCTNLTSITIPDSVTSMGDYAFTDCTNLTTISIGGRVTNISAYAFGGCTNLTSIEIPDSVTKIGDYAFVYCDNLTSITIPRSVKSIGTCAFEGCTKLTSVTIPDSVASINDYAFRECKNLISITIPDSVTTIGTQAFYGFTGTIYCYRDSYAMQYAIDNSLNYVIMDIGETENSTIDYINKVIFTTKRLSSDLEDIVYVPSTSEVTAQASTTSGSKDLLGTGSTLTVSDGDLSSEYKLVVIGDLNGDSVVDVIDCAVAQLYSAGFYEPTETEIFAANGCISDEIDVNAYQNVVNTCLAA